MENGGKSLLLTLCSVCCFHLKKKNQVHVKYYKVIIKNTSFVLSYYNTLKLRETR